MVLRSVQKKYGGIKIDERTFGALVGLADDLNLAGEDNRDGNTEHDNDATLNKWSWSSDK